MVCCVTRGSLYPNPPTVLPFLDSLSRCVLGGGRHLVCRGLPVFFSFRATYKQLVHIHPMGKFLAIKTIVFFSWWQVCLHATSRVACPCGGIALCHVVVLSSSVGPSSFCRAINVLFPFLLAACGR